MHRIFIFILPWLLAASALAKTNAPAPEGNRFLFVVDTSLAMSRVEHGGRQAVFDLIYSGIFKQMRTGDTFGIWTFNDDVSAGLYPMQTWDPAQNLEQASAAGLFLKGQRYEHKARLDRAVAKIVALVKNVKNVNVLIVTEGEGSLAKTGLDKNLIAAYTQTVEESRATKTPVVTTLIAQRGEIVSWSVTLAGTPIKLPHAVAANEVIPMLAPARVGPPLVPAPKPAETVSVPVTPKPIPSNASPAVAIVPPAPPRAIVIKQNPPKETVAPIAAKPESVGISTPTAIVSTPPPAVAPALPVTPAISKIEPVVAKNETEKMEPAPAPALTVVPPSMTAKPTPLPKIIPASATVAAREMSVANHETTSNAAPPALAPVLAVVPEPPTNPLHLLMVGGGLLIVGLSLVLFLVLRARSTYQPTFISRSINQR